MHSQAELIQHLSTMRRLLEERHAAVVSGRRTAELCLCSAIEEATEHNDEHPMQVAVKQMIQAAFTDDGQEYHKHRYIWPVACAGRSFHSESGFRGTVEQVAEGYTKRLALIDKWIAAAHKKLLVAVFRRALDTLGGLGRSFMCNELRRACRDLLGLTYQEVYSSSVYIKVMEVLHLFKPHDYKNAEHPWYQSDAHGAAMRKAVLNLCITEVTRGFK